MDVLKNPVFEAIAVDVEQQRGRDGSVTLTLTLTLVDYRYTVHTAPSPTWIEWTDSNNLNLYIKLRHQLKIFKKI